jgi:hypothetical protein
LVREPHDDAETTQVMASLRRLKAAFAASTLPNPVPDENVIAEIRRILQSEGLHNLLLHSPPGFFGDTIRRVKDAVGRDGDRRKTMERLREVLDAEELNAALATDDPDEQPDRLLHLMLEGPYKHAPRGIN